MTPDELALIRQDADTLDRPEDIGRRFASDVYAMLFELDPSTRSLFPEDLERQQHLLVAELTALAGLATDADVAGGELDERAAELGRRHAGYGVTLSHYDVLATAMLTSLAEVLPDFDERHRGAWDKLYRVVADAMTSGIDPEA